MYGKDIKGFLVFCHCQDKFFSSSHKLSRSKTLNKTISEYTKATID